MPMTYNEIVAFHGHTCPGLAIGYRMARAAMEALSAYRADDEEIVAIVENNSCGVDAVQCVTGCTFGKGNLIFHDYGKQVYTLYSRQTRAGVRAVFHGQGIPEGMREDKAAFALWVREAPDRAILSVEEVVVSEPERAKIHHSAACAFCGESVMETRLQSVKGKPACIPCADKKQHYGK
ncbi:MAG: FmdE family protein, partial [Pseudomonadota bacterium]